MNILNIIKRVDIPNLLGLIGLAIRYPLFLWPTYKATKKCIALSDAHFGKAHHKNGPSNAFRHSIWNFLIANYCTKWSKNEAKILKWTKAITDWHERTFLNHDLAKLMDLHNNEIGRYFFKEKPKLNLEEALPLFLEMTKKSVLIRDKKTFEEHKYSLVHLEGRHEG